MTPKKIGDNDPKWLKKDFSNDPKYFSNLGFWPQIMTPIWAKFQPILAIWPKFLQFRPNFSNLTAGNEPQMLKICK